MLIILCKVHSDIYYLESNSFNRHLQTILKYYLRSHLTNTKFNSNVEERRQVVSEIKYKTAMQLKEMLVLKPF